MSFPSHSLLCPFQVTVRKTWMRGQSYSPNVSKTDMQACRSILACMRVGIYCATYMTPFHLYSVRDRCFIDARLPALCTNFTFTLATSNDSHGIPLDHASYQVDVHQLEEAIVTPERGRALLWSEMRQFRASINKLQQADPELGERCTAVNRELEVHLTESQVKHG